MLICLSLDAKASQLRVQTRELARMALCLLQGHLDERHGKQRMLLRDTHVSQLGCHINQFGVPDVLVLWRKLRNLLLHEGVVLTDALDVVGRIFRCCQRVGQVARLDLQKPQVHLRVRLRLGNIQAR